MIDTNKYEGHTPAPWEEGEYIPSDEMIERFQNRELQGAVMQQGSNVMLAMIGLDGDGEKDRLLIADAPLILQALIDERAEVKRLRENLKRIRHTVFYDIEENFTDEQAYDPVLIEIMEKIQAVF
jgi:hypothetical protein